MNSVTSLPRDFLKINFIRIPVPVGRMSEAISFYKKSLGLDPNGEDTYFLLGDIPLQLFEIENNIITNSYLSMQVKDFLLAQMFLNDCSIDFDFLDSADDYQRLVFQDPFGNQIEFIEREKPFYNKIK